jgi:DNA-binding MarR family transcriptional regulator
LDDAIQLLHFGFHGAIRESIRRLSEVDLNRMDHTLLYVAEKFPGATVTEFVHHYGASKQALSAPLHKLVARGLVELRPNPDDRRVRHVYLTPEGLRIARWLNAGLQESLESAFRRAGSRAREGWFSVMRELASPLLTRARKRGVYAPEPVARTREEPTPASVQRLRVSDSKK